MYCEETEFSFWSQSKQSKTKVPPFHPKSRMVSMTMLNIVPVDQPTISLSLMAKYE